MLAIARAMSRLPKSERPKRSILFASVGAEEQGLLGSEYLAQNPPTPAGNLAAVATVAWFSDGLDLSSVSAGMEMMGVASVLYPSLQLKDLLVADLVVIVLGLLAGVSPALRAARCQPVEAIAKAA